MNDGEKLNNRFFSIFQLQSLSSISKQEVLAITTIDVNFINFSFKHTQLKLAPEETSLIGEWIVKNDQVRENDTAERIRWLVGNHLKKICTGESGWEVLYADPDDDRLWELVYLQSELHGGGPPSLIQISEQLAREKYDF